MLDIRRRQFIALLGGAAAAWLIAARAQQGEHGGVKIFGVATFNAAIAAPNARLQRVRFHGLGRQSPGTRARPKRASFTQSSNIGSFENIPEENRTRSASDNS